MTLLRWRDEASGLDAILCIDDPDASAVAGGIRTWRYASDDDAIADARDLARAMTIKCALAGVDAAGAKTVVRASKLRVRAAAFHALGRHIESLDGRYLAAGDLGTSADDLESVAQATTHVRTDEAYLATCVARSVRVSLDVIARESGRPIEHVGIRGCGAIGSAVARALAACRTAVTVEDLDPDRANRLAREIGARVVAPGALEAEPIDVLCPCGGSRDLEARAIASMRAWGLCGAANNILADAAAERAVIDAELWHVPDVIASAGAVLVGVAESRMGVEDTAPLFEKLGATARAVVLRSRAERRPADDVALELARTIVCSKESGALG